MMKQKDFVVAEVKRILGTRFIPFQTNAILLLSNSELELIKETTYNALLTKQVDYSNVKASAAETRAYARSMVMNHLKKARELNGNMVYSTSAGKTQAVKASTPSPTSGINLAVLPADLALYVQELV